MVNTITLQNVMNNVQVASIAVDMEVSVSQIKVVEFHINIVRIHVKEQLQILHVILILNNVFQIPVVISHH